jgi:VWFA-related protein
MCRIPAYLAIAAIAFLLTSPLQTQTAQTNATTFTSSTELVLIPTVVNDKSGAHIPGLQEEEFALKQDGKSHPIAVFEEVKTNSAREHRSQGQHGTFSNLEPGSSDYHCLNIIVLDFVNTPFPDQANARIALLKFLSEVAESGEPMCLLALTSRGLIMLHDFTDDPKRLAEGLRKVGPDTQPLIHESTVDPGHPPPDDALGKTITKLIRGQLQTEAQLASMERRETRPLQSKRCSKSRKPSEVYRGGNRLSGRVLVSRSR